MNQLIPRERIESKIFVIRDQKVMLDRDLAELYEVKPIRLREQVKRNAKRFPVDFMFQLNKEEKEELIANCDRFKIMKHSPTNPYVFTEQGVAMLSSVLNSERAILVNIQIMRAFTRMRKILSSHEELRRKVEDMERKYDAQFGKYDTQFKIIFDAIKALMAPPPERTIKIGF
ncbi:MAG: ORF6N domain-containing protein [bacterium]